MKLWPTLRELAARQCTMWNAQNIFATTLARYLTRSIRVRTCADTWCGRCLTISNGGMGTPSVLVSCASTMTLSNAFLKTARCGSKSSVLREYGYDRCIRSFVARHQRGRREYYLDG